MLKQILNISFILTPLALSAVAESRVQFSEDHQILQYDVYADKAFKKVVPKEAKPSRIENRHFFENSIEAIDFRRTAAENKKAKKAEMEKKFLKGGKAYYLKKVKENPGFRKFGYLFEPEAYKDTFNVALKKEVKAFAPLPAGFDLSKSMMLYPEVEKIAEQGKKGASYAVKYTYLDSDNKIDFYADNLHSAFQRAGERLTRLPQLNKQPLSESTDSLFNSVVVEKPAPVQMMNEQDDFEVISEKEVQQARKEVPAMPSSAPQNMVGKVTSWVKGFFW